MDEVSDRTLFVQPTTGGRIKVSMPAQSSISSLKLAIAQKLKLPKDKIILLHKNKQLKEGSLLENNLLEGSKLTLLPNVETGIAAQNPEQSVVQALETLSESQVDNFLAGRSPLHLSMRIGDHMMFIQLQLSNSVAPPPSSPQFLKSPQGLRRASRHLTHTLRHLSSAALANKMNETCDGRCCLARRNGGAVIESMYHHGRGVFSGTFSGTLSPLLQDKEGRPRRDICTILSILNDLLGASSHCNSPCSPVSPTTHKKKDDSITPEENRVLREKVEQIQALLKQKRQQRRQNPYPRRQKLSSEAAVA